MKKRYIEVRNLLADNGYKMSTTEKVKRQFMMLATFSIVLLVVAFLSDLGFILPNSELRWRLLCVLAAITLVFVPLSLIFRKLPKCFNLLSILVHVSLFSLLSLFWSSFWQTYFSVFVIFVFSNILLCLLSIAYNLAIIKNIEDRAWEYQNHMLFLPTSMFLIGAAVLIVLVRLLNLSGYFVVIAVEMLTIGISQLNMYPYLLILDEKK